MINDPSAIRKTGTEPIYRRYRPLIIICALAACVILVLFGIRLFLDRQYILVSVLIAVAACIPFYAVYERREGSVRRMILVAAMTAIAVVGRLIFAAVPAFNPVAAVVIITAVYIGPESGFVTGSFTALLSNIFMGQGPWTPFQMLAWGTIGLIAGLPFIREKLKKPLYMVIYGCVAGIYYSCIMEIWDVFALDGSWNGEYYLALFGTSLPFTLIYIISNVVFILLAARPIGKKLERIQVKHGIF